jgi:membrane protease YdiL (CAAX protease family)
MLSAKPWRLEVVIWFCAAQLISLCLGVTIVGLLQKAGFAVFQPPAGPGAVLLGTLAFQGVTWVLIFIFLRQHHMNWRDAFGFCGPKLNRVWLLAVLVVCAILPVAWLLQIGSVHALTKIGWQPENETAVMVLASAKEWWLCAYLGVFTVVIAPVAEEFIFRGVLYPFVKQLGSPRYAFFGINALFALIHLDAATFVPLFVLALALTWLYEYTDNLVAPIAAHALFNAANYMLLLVVNSAPNA